MRACKGSQTIVKAFLASEPSRLSSLCIETNQIAIRSTRVGQLFVLTLSWQCLDSVLMQRSTRLDSVLTPSYQQPETILRADEHCSPRCTRPFSTSIALPSSCRSRARALQRQWRLARILLTTTGVAAVIVFVLVVVPALGSAYDGFRNVVIIVFANLQIVAIIGQVPEVPALRCAQRLMHYAYMK